ncbi:mandelate racemase/muconate lactonizing enzyme family protein [Halobaculum sp. MBLA0143]|uniref:mandelate racemase/muconate lactonizing enzyme family protein n=1 Tax=Halobaculum sp. MBLA0143 TaxID=3079933 RepID=UPI00352361BA
MTVTPTWRTRSFSLPLASPLGTANGEIRRREGLLVGVDGDCADGGDSVGVGEATPLPGWTESLADCRAALQAATGGDGAPVSPRRGRLPGPETPAARFAVTLAHRDRLARRRGVSVAATLATDPPATVPANATVGDGDRETTVAAARGAVAAGFETLKLKIGARDPATDRERVRAVADAVGEASGATADPDSPGPTLRADANGAWNRATARETLSALEGVVAYVEQPVPATDLTGLAALRGVGAPVAADEALAEHGPTAVLTADAADVLVCKPQALGGLERTLGVARTAAVRGVDTVVTTTVDGAVARTAATHLAAAVTATTGRTRAHGLATGDLLARDVQTPDGEPIPDPVPVSDGRVPVPTGPGLAGDTFASVV